MPLVGKREKTALSTTASLTNKDVMSEQENIFIIRECSCDDIKQCVDALAKQIHSYFPFVEIIHVGSTAVPGCLTKGDIDIVVRVAQPDFSDTLAILDRLFVRSNRNATTQDYAEFDYSSGRLPVSIQLVTINGARDDFHKITEILNHDKNALRSYNDLKIVFNNCSMDEYRQAKSEFLEELISTYNTKKTG